MRLSHQLRSSPTVPRAAASSAYHICVTEAGSLLISGMVAMAYIGIARGSPCVVPSLEKITSPSMNNSVGARYVLIKHGGDGRAEKSDVVKSYIPI